MNPIKPKRKTINSLRKEKNLLRVLLLMSLRKEEEPILVPEKILVKLKKDRILVEMTTSEKREEVHQEKIIVIEIMNIDEYPQEGTATTKILMLVKIVRKPTDLNVISLKRKGEELTLRDMDHLQEAA